MRQVPPSSPLQSNCPGGWNGRKRCCISISSRALRPFPVKQPLCHRAGGENESSDVVFTEISSNQARIRPVNRTGPDGNCFYPRQRPSRRPRASPYRGTGLWRSDDVVIGEAGEFCAQCSAEMPLQRQAVFLLRWPIGELLNVLAIRRPLPGLFTPRRDVPFWVNMRVRPVCSEPRR
jgi:hypothetical protein